MEKFTVAILVNNQFGVLNRVTSMFRRRQFNITSLTVSETESEDFSRITIKADGDEVKREQAEVIIRATIINRTLVNIDNERIFFLRHHFWQRAIRCYKRTNTQ